MWLSTSHEILQQCPLKGPSYNSHKRTRPPCLISHIDRWISNETLHVIRLPFRSGLVSILLKLASCSGRFTGRSLLICQKWSQKPKNKFWWVIWKLCLEFQTTSHKFLESVQSWLRSAKVFIKSLLKYLWGKVLKVA